MYLMYFIYFIHSMPGISLIDLITHNHKKQHGEGKCAPFCCGRAEGAPIVVWEQANQVDPVHQVNQVDELHQVHQVDLVHQVI